MFLDLALDALMRACESMYVFYVDDSRCYIDNGNNVNDNIKVCLMGNDQVISQVRENQ